ncbi:hypothetical protein IFM89_001095 [Coptis chinensis]|uniref:Uncharacterized protein n=1 Tax=Coptis chinensis TaxID=261450 RepID=A0A835HJQ6_9MAGN|nr:hypothetical protein IFM89_001095 [Coptis chinensis]
MKGKPTPRAIIGERRSSKITKLATPKIQKDPTVIEESPTRVNPVMERVEDLKSKLENGCPSFVKPMTQSYLKGGTWLGSGYNIINGKLVSKGTVVLTQLERKAIFSGF